jgi:hypothetical protein
LGQKLADAIIFALQVEQTIPGEVFRLHSAMRIPLSKVVAAQADLRV